MISSFNNFNHDVLRAVADEIKNCYDTGVIFEVYMVEGRFRFFIYFGGRKYKRTVPSNVKDIRRFLKRNTIDIIKNAHSQRTRNNDM